jgi:general secretion pathway protein G
VKRGFSLIELIFAIVVIGIIATVAIPKLTNLTSKANVSTIKSDINTLVSSVQNYYILNNKIDKISDSVTLNNSTWEISDKEVIFVENGKTCVKIILEKSNLILTIESNVGDICQTLHSQGIKNTTYKLN